MTELATDMTFNGRRVIRAADAKAWSFGSKITIWCGNCAYGWKTKEWSAVTNWNNNIVATCPCCQEINYTGFKRSY